MKKGFIVGKGKGVYNTGNPLSTDNILPLSSDGEPNVQVDWNETDTNSDAYIKNKPSVTDTENIVRVIQIPKGDLGTIDKAGVVSYLNSNGITITAEEIIAIELTEGGSTVDAIVSGSVIFLDAGDPASYSGSGTTIFNLGSYSGDGTISGGVTYSTNNSGILEFHNSATEKISIQKVAGDLNNSDHTITIWVKSDVILSSINSSDRVTLYKDTLGWTPGLWYNGDVIRAHTEGKFVDRAWTMDTGWHQIGQRYNSTTGVLEVILDGVAYSNTPSAYSASSSSTLEINPPELESSLTGDISNFIAYPSFLTDQELLDNYNLHKVRFGL